MNNIPVYIRIAGIFLVVSLLHILFGWLVPLTACFLLVGFILDEYIMLTVTVTGTIVNSIPTLYYYFNYRESAAKITADLSKAFGNIDEIMIMLISLLIPLIMYTIAGLFAWQIAEVRIKLRD
jgi:hypothetical protein